MCALKTFTLGPHQYEVLENSELHYEHFDFYSTLNLIVLKASTTIAHQHEFLENSELHSEHFDFPL